MGNTEALTRDIVAAVRKVTGPGKIDLHKPFATKADAENVYRAAVEQPVGHHYIAAFEELVADACGVKHAIAVSSGTAALHLALLVCGVGRGSRVSLPTLTFAAAAAAIRYCGADIVFDQPNLANVDARVAVDLLGDVDMTLALRGYHGPSPIIEDAAEALGSRFNGKPCGSFGTIGIMSFNSNKIVTTGGGGAVLTNDDDTAERVRHLATTAKIPSPFYFEHDMVGFNYRMSNMAAAFGLGQMLALPAILQVKRNIAAAYREAFAGLVYDRPEEPGHRPNYWLNAITVPDKATRNAVLMALQAEGIAARAIFTPLHEQKPYQHWSFHHQSGVDAVERFQRTICLPSGATSFWHL